MTINVKNKKMMVKASFTFAVISIFIISSLMLNPNSTAIAQVQQPQQQQVHALDGTTFNINNTTFSHRVATVNGIQMHYVIGGQGNPLVLLHGFPQTWYEWRHVMPALAKNYTVIVPDLRGLGDSSKPVAGYDGNTTAEDLYQLMSQLGIGKKIYLVGHDIGAQTAYSYAAIHPENVSKLVIMDFIFPGFLPPQFGQNGPWWFTFHQVPNLPEFLVEGKEREYISSFVKMLAYNPSAITERDLDIYTEKYSVPGAMRDGFEYYRAFPLDAEQNEALVNQSKLHIPVLVLEADFYPVFGGAVQGIPVADAVKAMAQNVTGIKVPLSGHWIPEEQPNFVLKQLANFFGGNNAAANNTVTR
jgi:pimeloyl-ACP methyl ester carboxylesterase